MSDVFLITPPFTQLNTPYPATAYLKGFLKTKHISCFQADLGIEVILELFSGRGLTELFAQIKRSHGNFSDNARRIIALSDDYVSVIDSVIQFLQGKNPTLALQICQDDFLPEASRFSQLEELDWAFGAMGTQDKAKHLATLFLEDISDLIVECADGNFGFSRYAERLGRSANSFDELYEELGGPLSYIDAVSIRILEQRIATVKPKMVLISVPFPGNLFSAFRCAQWIKQHHPEIKISMGGGFPNTELRSLSDARVFEFFDFITLDDGELPVELLLDYIGLTEKPAGGELKRTFLRENDKVAYRNDSLRHDYKQHQVGTPDYSDLMLDRYISVIEIVNPMHRMWSDGRWNKLTMAHGCYWGKCTFCDISLDYIKIYEPVAATLLCDRMEELILQTGQNGFHFVDEAAPPALMRALALEILKRKLTVTWWTNIRFEKSFTYDLARLLKASGCIAVSGGLEVASDRLLQLIDKGVTVEQVAKVTRNFTENGILVHAYLMYGYPTQTVQETVDSLEMVRQLFEAGVLQSGFWHQFAMTTHSPVGMEPQKFGVVVESDIVGSFANNDVAFTDTTGIDHEKFSFGLRKSLFNYMHGICFDYELQDWFDFKIPKTKIRPDFIQMALRDDSDFQTKPTSKIVWTGKRPVVSAFTKSKKGNSWPMLSLEFHDRRSVTTVQMGEKEGEWLLGLLENISAATGKPMTFAQVKSGYESTVADDFELFWFSKPMEKLKEAGLLVL
ncbi:B12-binding domain-containing radical SAM protein [Flavobacterium selenitireducens]|uniref:B12-binding domain-containing radical SAM protein n=1 Tax=Flavobacterium selenitireducens TaxID=2722704 RepID=UPI00168A45A6|nr:radical SAM protein [Flavobacterium selenitireducens]MBD3582576.1 radical SAM protein [Flavobacterium selenitireducens]